MGNQSEKTLRFVRKMIPKTMYHIRINGVVDSGALSAGLRHKVVPSNKSIAT